MSYLVALENAAADNEQCRRERKILWEALFKIVGASHSWVITEATGAIEMPIHAKYREMAQNALNAVNYKGYP